MTIPFPPKVSRYVALIRAGLTRSQAAAIARSERAQKGVK